MLLIQPGRPKFSDFRDSMSDVLTRFFLVPQRPRDDAMSISNHVRIFERAFDVWLGWSIPAARDTMLPFQ